MPLVVGADQMVTGDYAGDAIHAASSGSVQLTVKSTLDIDGNGVTDALTDGLMLIRYLFGLRGTALVANAIGANATRMTAADIETYLSSLQ